MNLLPSVEAVIRKYAMLNEGDGVVVACSGGPDSLTLLGLLSQLREKLCLKLTAVYVDHRLRPEAATEGELVAKQAADWGISARVCVVEQDLHSGIGSVQALAREERYRLLHQVARETGSQRIAVGHTADDQAETLVMRFLRGTGTQGLGGIPPVNGLVVRPLLYTSRTDTEAYCQENGLNPVTDSSNLKDDYARNQIRHHLIPVLDDYNPKLKEALLHLADIVRCDNVWMEEAVDQFVQLHVLDTDKGKWCYRDPFVAQPVAMQRRVIRTLVRKVRRIEGYLGQEVEFAHVEAILELLQKGITGTGLPLPGGIDFVIERSGFWIGPTPVCTCFNEPLCVPGETILPSGLGVSVSLGGGAKSNVGELHRSVIVPAGPWQVNGRKASFDYNAVCGQVIVRNRAVGDKYQPAGLQGAKKLQDIFVDEGIPRRWRNRLPIFADEKGVIWVPGSRPATRVQVTLETVASFEVTISTTGQFGS